MRTDPWIVAIRVCLTVPVHVVLLTVLLSGSVHGGTVPGLTPDKNWDVSGYVTYRSTVSYPENTSHSFDQMLHQRLNTEYRFHPDFHFNAGLRNRLIWGDAAKNARYVESIAEDNGYFDFSSNWRKKSGVVGNSQLDRFYVTWAPQDWLVKAGRQRINWGTATVWNPNDLFNAYSLYDIDYVERPGTDAALVGYKTGFASGVELVVKPGDHGDRHSWSGRWFFNTHGWDIQLLGGKSDRDHVVGFGFSGDIQGADFRGELSYFYPDHHDVDGNRGESALVSALEAGYHFPGERNGSVKAAWLYIENVSDGIDATAFLTQSLSARTLSFTRNSFYGETGLDLSALLRLTLSGVYYQDNSYYLTVSGQYSLANNWQLSSGAQYFGGTDNSVYGQAENTSIYLLIKYSF